MMIESMVFGIECWLISTPLHQLVLNSFSDDTFALQGTLISNKNNDNTDSSSESSSNSNSNNSNNKEGWKWLGCVCVTNACRKNAEFMLQSLQIQHYFDHLVIGDECSHGKPHPGMYALSLSPSSSLSFPSSAYDIFSSYLFLLPIDSSLFGRDEKNWSEASRMVGIFIRSLKQPVIVILCFQSDGLIHNLSTLPLQPCF